MLYRCLFSNNTATYTGTDDIRYGGGAVMLYNTDVASLTVDSCISLTQSVHAPVVFSGCTFLNNHATQRGGAVLLRGDSGFYNSVT